MIAPPASRPVLEAARGPAAASRTKALTDPWLCAAGAGRLTFAATSPKPAPAPAGPPASAQTRKPDPPENRASSRPDHHEHNAATSHEYRSRFRPPRGGQTRKHPQSVLAGKIRPLLLGSAPISRQPVSSAYPDVPVWADNSLTVRTYFAEITSLQVSAQPGQTGRCASLGLLIGRVTGRLQCSRADVWARGR